MSVRSVGGECEGCTYVEVSVRSVGWGECEEWRWR